jgi:hypothetical protein
MSRAGFEPTTPAYYRVNTVYIFDRVVALIEVEIIQKIHINTNQYNSLE